MTVVSLGGVGTNRLMAGMIAGAKRIVTIDLRADKLRPAADPGETDTRLAGSADVAEDIGGARGGGRDTVLETAGSIPAMKLAYADAARGSSLVSSVRPGRPPAYAACVSPR